MRLPDFGPMAHRERCAYCGLLPEGNYSIERDGFCSGDPIVELCDACGGSPTPTCEEIWERIRERRENEAS